MYRTSAAWIVLVSLSTALACGSNDDAYGGLRVENTGGAGGYGAGGGIPVTAQEEPGQWLEQEGLPDVNAGGPASPPQVECPGVATTSRILDVSLASPGSFASAQLALELLDGGLAPIPQLVRTQDFLNYFVPEDLAGSPHGQGGLGEVAVQLAQVEGNTFDLLVVLRASQLEPPTNNRVVVLIDDTNSMGSAADPQSPLARAKELAGAIRDATGTTDFLLRTVSGAQPASVDEIVGSGSEGSIAVALHEVASAAETSPRTGEDRHFLISDGKDDPESLPSSLEIFRQLGASLNVISVAPADDHPARFFRAVYTLGAGHYAHARTDSELSVVKTTLLPQMLVTALRDVRLRLDLPWYFEIVKPKTEEPFIAGVAPPKNVGAAGVHTFLVRLQACSTAVIPGSDMKVGVSFQDAENEYLVELPLDVKQTLNPPTPYTEVTRVRAVHDVAEALKTLDRDALVAARAKLAAAIGNGSANAALSTLLEKLDGHPLLAP